MKSIINHKKTGALHSFGKLLPINIAEAMCHDVKQGCLSNAECGFELMVEPNNKISDVKGSSPGRTWKLETESVNMGICKAYCAFPEVWNNLYQSWNMAFVSNT